MLRTADKEQFMKKLLAVALAAAVMFGVPSVADAYTGKEKSTVAVSSWRSGPSY